MTLDYERVSQAMRLAPESKTLHAQRWIGLIIEVMKLKNSLTHVSGYFGVLLAHTAQGEGGVRNLFKYTLVGCSRPKTKSNNQIAYIIGEETCVLQYSARASACRLSFRPTPSHRHGVLVRET